MTYAPTRLLEVRRFLKPILGLSDTELGIVGDSAHIGGYHHGWDQRRTAGDYSWSESIRDSSHKSNAARGFDLGWFDRVIGGKRITLIDFNLWFVGELKANKPDTRDVREFIYTPDGRTVKRWDRLGRRTSGDSSHLRHSHISYFADAEDRDKTAVLRRFFGGDTMSPIDEEYVIRRLEALLLAMDTFGASREPNYVEAGKPVPLVKLLKDTAGKVDALGKLELTDEQLTVIAEKVAAKLPKPPTAAEIAAELAARLAA